MLTGGVATLRQNEPNPRPGPFENLTELNRCAVETPRSPDLS